MLNKLNLEKILFLDIETVPQVYSYNDVDEKAKELFNSKVRFKLNDTNTFEDLYNERGGIFAEFGKIVCISVGFAGLLETVDGQ